MFAKSLLVSLVLAVASVRAADSLYISTPNELKQCEEATFAIKGANGAVWPFVVNPSAPCDDPLRELKDVTGDLKWKPDLPVGTSVMLAIEDGAGNEGWSGALTIQPGNDSSCVPSSSSYPPSTSSTPATSPAATSPSSNNKVNSGPDTPQNAQDNTGNKPSDAAPARRLALSCATVLTILSALVLVL